MAMSVQIILNFPCSDVEIEKVLKIHAFMGKKDIAMNPNPPSGNGMETLGEPLTDDEKSQIDKSSWKTHEDDSTPLMDSLESEKVTVPSLLVSLLRENGGRAPKNYLIDQVSQAFPDLPISKIQSRLASAAKTRGIKKENSLFCEEWILE